LKPPSVSEGATTSAGGPTRRGPAALHRLPTKAVLEGTDCLPGTGVIAGREVFQRPMDDDIALPHANQDVYLDPPITIA
jgi:DhnA family fructose-bisphosphate aldolase class Ia